MARLVAILCRSSTRWSPHLVVKAALPDADAQTMRLFTGSGLFSLGSRARALLARVPSDESGSFLVEVCVTAVIVVVVALGTFAAFDGASASSANVKSRAVGAGLAQQDQERLRAFKATDLSNYRQSRTQAVAGVNYTVASRADWVTDSTGSTSCGGGNAQANYLEITSTVTWPRMNEVQPVVVKSLIAPPNGSFGPSQGSLCVQLLCNTTGASGVGVSLTGAGAFSDVTDSTGSVFFGYIPTGNYTVTAQDTGIDRAGATPPSKQASVVGATTSTITLDDCQPGALKVKFDTQPYGGAAIASRNKFGFSLGNSGLAAPSFRTFFNGLNDFGLYGDKPPAPGLNDGTATFTAGSLYPFSPEPYAAWAGNCFAERPDQIVPGGTVGQQLIAPATTAGPITLRQPALNLVVNSVAGAPLKDARVRATAKSPGCGGTIDLGNTSSVGKLDDPGLPYGTYDICAENKNAANAQTATAVRIDDPNGSATFPIQLRQGGGSCP